MQINIFNTITIVCVILMGIIGHTVNAAIEPGFGDGSDGDLTVTSEITVDDVRTAVTGSNAAGGDTIEVSDASGFSVGDEALIISMQDPETNLDLNVAGQYETKRITAISGNTLTLDSALTHTYDAGNNRKHQVQRVPQYQNVTVESGGTITCHAWDGTTGGIAFFRATGTVTVEDGGRIDVSGKGYRGGAKSANNSWGPPGFQGESYFGVGSQDESPNGSGGGGGAQNGGGGGGGYAILGIKGEDFSKPDYYGRGGEGGRTVGNPMLSKIYLGGAGGGGHQNNDQGTNGGNGAGILIISANTVEVLGSIKAQGASASNAGIDGAGGGGAGGTMYLISINLSNARAIVAFGGKGGIAAGHTNPMSNGGNGGYGRIRIDCDTLDNTGTIDPTPTYNKPKIVISDSQIDFGQVQIAQYTKSITFGNAGVLNLNIKLAIHNPSYTVEPVTNFTLAFGETKEIVIRFAPVDEWFTENGILRVSSNALNNGEIQIELHGTGIPYSNKAISFDGDGDFGKVAHNDSINFGIDTPFTIEGWFNTTQTSDVTTWDVIMAKWAGTGGYPYAIMLNPANGALMVSVSDGFFSVNVMSSKGNLNDGKWHHFAAVNAPDTHTLKLIVDNLETTSDTSALGAIANTSELFFGKRGGNDPAYFAGQLDEVRIWSAVRTPEELRANQILTVAARENGLVAYWRFDEQSGSNTPDISGKDNNVEMSGNATLISAEWPHGDVGPIITEINPSRAETGDTVTITGEHFGSSQGKSTIKFGEIDAGKAMSWSDTSIMIKVPAVGGAVVSVTVTVDGLQSKGVKFVLSGEISCNLTNEFNAQIPLTPGINMISLPLNPDTPYTASTFADALNSTIVIQVDNGSFDAYVRAGSIGNDFPIEMSKGYIVNIMDDKPNFQITGKPWGQPIPVAPSRILANSATTSAEPWAFVIAGQIDGTIPDNGRLRVTNLRTGESIVMPISPSGEFTAAFVDMSRRSVVDVGDEISVQIERAGCPLYGWERYIVTPENFEHAYLLANIKAAPIKTQLLQNYPNPFNPETWIPYQLAKPSDVSIRIYNASGQLIRTLALGQRQTGFYVDRAQAAYWNGRNASGERVASGLYFYQIVTTGNFTATRRMLIIK